MFEGIDHVVISVADMAPFLERLRIGPASLRERVF